MTPLAFFLRTVWRTSAIFLGATLVFVNPSLEWSAPQHAVTAQKSPKQAAIDGLISALHDRDAGVRRDAATALRDIDTAAAHPALTALRADQAREVAELTTDLGAAEPAARTRAACELRELGSQAAPAIPALVKLLADGAPVAPSVCKLQWWRGNEQLTSPGEQAASALVAIGTRAVEPILGALKSPAWIARRNAAWALGALDDRRAVGPLVATLEDSEPPVRSHAAWALGAIDDAAAVPGLIEALKDASPEVRRHAAWALGAIGDPRAVPSLLPALKDEDTGVRRHAAWAIGAIGR